MRTRARRDFKSFLWVLTSFSQIALGAVRMDKDIFRNRTGWIVADSFTIILWLFVLAIYAVQALNEFWEVTPTGIRHRQFWTIKDIPFNTIAAIRLKNSPAANLEIEVARLGKDIYPHQYLNANSGDLNAFLEAIELQVPSFSSNPEADQNETAPPEEMGAAKSRTFH